MKKIFLLAGLLSLVVLFGLPENASAGTSIEGLNGGTGWAGPWTVNVDPTMIVEDSPSNVPGDRALSAVYSSANRQKPSSEDGIVSFKVRAGTTYSGVSFTDSGGGGANNNRFSVSMNNPNFFNPGLIVGDGQTSQYVLTPTTQGTWYKIGIKYGHVAGKFAVSLDDGPYGPDYDMGPGNTSLIDGIGIFANDTSPGDIWVDNIEYRTLASSTVTTTENFDTYQNTSITASTGTNGNISPSEILNASIVGPYTFTITPDAGFQISDVIIDGVSVGPTTSYIFSNFTNANHTISASFSAITGGTGAINRIAKFVTSSTLGNSLFSDDGVNTTLTSGNLFIPTGSIGIGTSTPSTKLFVNGDLFANWIKVAANSFGLDTLTSGTLYIGSTTASSIKIGRSGIITTIFGTTTVSGLTANTANISGSVSTGVLTSSSANISGTLSAGATTLGSLSASYVTTSGSVTASSGIFTNSNTGTTTVSSLKTTSNCNSSASPAVCGSAPSGSVAMATGGSTLVVNTTAVTANSQIMITEDSSLGARLGITCNTTTTRNYRINARVASTSFTIKSSANPATNKACLSYWIIN